MDAVIQTLQTGLPILLTHSVATFILLFMAVTFYMKVTPYCELELIKQGNSAASIVLSGALLGIAIPLAFCLNGSFSLIDILLWGLVIVLLQIVAFKMMDVVFKGLSAHIERGNIAMAMFVSAIKLSIAAVTSAAIAL